MSTLTDFDRLIMGGFGGALLDTYFAGKIELHLMALGFSTGVVGAFLFSLMMPKVNSNMVMMVIGGASTVIANSILKRSN